MAKTESKRDEYFATIIHDLKTPIVAQIAALKSFLDTASPKISQEEEDLILLTLKSCDYMQRLVETFNAVNKLDYEKLKLNYEIFDLTTLVRDIIKELDILLKYHELELIFTETKDFIVNADKLQIKRVVENLISNSISYAYKNTQIKIKILKQGNNINFEIENKSPYMETKTLKEIFGKFKTKGSLYKQGGTGLGLYLSSEIIQAHFGNMIARSTQNDTNIFGFQLPI